MSGLGVHDMDIIIAVINPSIISIDQNKITCSINVLSQYENFVKM